MQQLVFVLSLLFSFQVLANGYYGQAFVDDIERAHNDAQIKTAINKVLNGIHVKQKNGVDQIAHHCPPNAQNQRRCYQRKVLSYKEARRALFGELHFGHDNRGDYVNTVYCSRRYYGRDVGRGQIPDHTIVNCEHTWPQSRFNPHQKNKQKSDLHHLFPTDSQMNSERGHMRFGDVTIESKHLKCGSSLKGQIGQLGYEDPDAGDLGTTFYEPPQEHKGNVARALFYFSVHYDLKISKIEEFFLRKWHKEDPIDEAEMARNDKIMQIQGNRNPFIDYPLLVDLISDF